MENLSDYNQQPHKLFIELWVSAIKQGKNQVWIAEQLGITRQAVYHRANKLRQSGVNLPQIHSKPNAPVLNDFIKSKQEELNDG